MESPQWKYWEAAIQEEYQSLVENGTWIPMETLPNQTALNGKWVFKIKRGASGEILRYKARWVVRGFQQREGVDDHETFASGVKPMSYKAIFAQAAACDWEIEQMDVKIAFLYGEIDTDIYVELPTGCGGSGTCKMNKALYGLKQSPRVWYNILSTFLEEQGFYAVNADASVFCREGTIIAIYVDDLLIAGDSKSIQAIEDGLSKRFQMTDLGACHFNLGMEVIRDGHRPTLRLSQEAYLRRVFGRLWHAPGQPNRSPNGGERSSGPRRRWLPGGVFPGKDLPICDWVSDVRYTRNPARYRILLSQ
jgi:hypothetical protein